MPLIRPKRLPPGCAGTAAPPGRAGNAARAAKAAARERAGAADARAHLGFQQKAAGISAAYSRSPVGRSPAPRRSDTQ